MANIEAGALIYDAVTDIGCVRKLNEDSIFTSKNLWLLADGMGGHASGDLASQLAVAVIADEYSVHGNLCVAIEKAHSRILAEGINTLQSKGMGTTIVALTSTAEKYEIAWVGDSRAYLFQGGSAKLTPLTCDHSLVADLIKQSLLTPEQAKSHPGRHIITRCLGSKNSDNFRVDHVSGYWQPEQQILLCSDGLYGDMEECKIGQLIGQAQNPTQALEWLVSAAKQAGGKDNISAILVKYSAKN